MPRTITTGMDPTAKERKYFQLFKVTLLDATVLRYTDADAAISHNAGDGLATWDAAPGIRRGPIRAGIDLQIDTTEVTVPNRDLALSGLTRTIAHWARLRKFHGAQVDIYIYDEANAKSMLHSSWHIQGIAPGTVDDVTFILESVLAKLDVVIPRTVFQPECNNALYDAFCGVNKTAFKETGTVTAAGIDSITFSTARAAGYFDLGQVVFTSGNLNGGAFTIATHETGGVIKFLAALPEIPTIGTTFDIYPGCHKTLSDCLTKFNNLANFRGFPFIPDTEQAFG